MKSVKLALLGIFYSVQPLFVASAAEMNLPDTPIFLNGSKTALVQLVVQRDNKLFYEAYPSYEDFNGDGVLDISYMPDEIEYYGYFGSDLCYTHTGDYFQATSDADNKRCLTNDASWSGDFLNYLSMTRMDIMRRALYGGKRVIDTADKTVLRRAFVPWENHTWGIEFTSEAVDGFKISDYSPLAEPDDNHRHHIATNNFINKGDVPYLRIRENSDGRIWEWVDKAEIQGDGVADLDLILDVEACRAGFLESVCQSYPSGINKPGGILHEYGENNRMYFSLITGSYENNAQGGVLRQAMSSFGEEEVDSSTGIFKSDSGIVNTLDAIRIPNDFIDDSTVHEDCGWLWYRAMTNGECRSWGNPVAEMMYEGMRYLAGSQSPTSSFFTDSGMDEELGLEVATWDDPYSDDQPYSQCSAAYQLVISDPSPSFDGDDLPGSDFGNFTASSLGDMHVGNLADLISENESEIPGMKFIGEANGVYDGSPSPKYVSSFRNIRGQAPEAPHRQGSYYAPSVAYFGHQNDLQPDVSGDQTVGNFTLALGSQLPTFDIEVAGQSIKFAPFSKTVGGCGRPLDVIQAYAPTNSIVGFVVEDHTPTSGSFRVSFEDMEQGADNDLDAIGRYQYTVNGNSVEFTVDSIEAAGCYIQHLGYSVSGSTEDGVYLVVRDRATSETNDTDFKLDVPPGESPGSGWDDDTSLPLTSTRTFTPSSTPAAETLKSPLWYAAKWGGFVDSGDLDGVPQSNEWDSDADGDPDNYFTVTNPGEMRTTLQRAFNAIEEASGGANEVGVSSGSLVDTSRIYEATFQSGSWYGDLTSRAIDVEGNIADTFDWNVNTRLESQIENDSRTILTYKPSQDRGIAFRWPTDLNNLGDDELDDTQVNYLSRDPTTNSSDNRGADRLDFVRGVAFDDFRTRIKPLGDIIASTPQLVGPPVYYYSDNWGEGQPETDNPYSAFGKQYATRDRTLYVGANDGMLHAFDAGSLVDGEWTAGTGDEVFAYVPSIAYKNLPELTSVDYGHKYFVDVSPTIGDAIIDDNWRTVLVSGMGKGGQGVFALDVTDVDSVSEDGADATVLWEFTEADNAGRLGYVFTSPLIARMHNGKWAAIFGNGYNSTADDGHSSSDGRAAIFIVDLETGELIKELTGNLASLTKANGINAPTAVDLDNDSIVDIIYAADLRGRITKYDVRSENPDNWTRIGNRVIVLSDSGGADLPVTAGISVGSHPTGQGVMIYAATGKYLEPSDQEGLGHVQSIFGIWDNSPFSANNSRFPNNDFSKLLKQSINNEKTLTYDSDGDGTQDSSAFIRESTQTEIDWDVHRGWQMTLDYPDEQGEQVITRPLLREGRLIVSTQIPGGDECNPSQDGWLMLLDADSGAMPDPSIDLDEDGIFSLDETFSGVKGINNPLSAPTIVATPVDDIILTNDSEASGATSTTLDSTSQTGRVNWRELEP